MEKITHKRFPTNLKIPEIIDFVGLYFDDRGYRVHIIEFDKENADILEIDFGYANLAQRSMDEGSYLNMSWELVDEKLPAGPIAIVEGSGFVDWFLKESCGVYERKEVQHVIILTQNEWVEVLCSRLPSLRWI